MTSQSVTDSATPQVDGTVQDTTTLQRGADGVVSGTAAASGTGEENASQLAADASEGEDATAQDGDEVDSADDASADDASADGSLAMTAASSNTPSVDYNAHVQNQGWQAGTSLDSGTVSTWSEDGETAGTTGKGLRLEAIQIILPKSGYSGSILYNTHVSNVGWQNDVNNRGTWFSDGDIAGTVGKAKTIEAIQIALSGNVGKSYDVYYRTHVQNIGWMDWVSNGAVSGTTGRALRVEAIQIRLVDKSSMSGFDGRSDTPVIYGKTEVEGKGWSDPAACDEDVTLGTTGRGLRMEGLALDIDTAGVGGSLKYQVHVSNVGWMDSVSAGETTGVIDGGHQIEAIRISLTGSIANLYDIYYQAHVQDIGWMDRVSNGSQAGTTGPGKRMEALRIALVKKGSAAPDSKGDSTNSDSGNTGSKDTGSGNSGNSGTTTDNSTLPNGMYTRSAAVSRMIDLVTDPVHGYDQEHRDGPDYDCSSAVCEAYGVYHTNTVGIPSVFGNLGCDVFEWDGNASDLEPGDLIGRPGYHVILYIGDGMIAEFSQNENGGVVGGQTGDQTGKESRIGKFYVPSFGWTYVISPPHSS